MCAEVQERGGFDSIIVGTSPVGLIEALHLAREGRRVLVVDNSDRAGGAWSTIDLGPFRRVEMGPHFIKWREGLYEMIEPLDFDMRVMRPQPRIVLAHPLFGMRFAPLNWSWLNTQSTALAEAGPWRKPFILARIAYTAVRRVLHLGPAVNPSRYPADGCQGLIDRLCELARRAGVEIRLETPVTRVEASSRERGVRVTLDGAVLDAGEFVFTSALRLDEIIVDGKPVGLDDAPQIADELVLAIENNGPPRFNWVAMKNEDTLLHMVSDVTAFTRDDGAAAAESMAAISIRIRPGWAHDQETLDEVMRRLRALGLIAEGARVAEHRWLRFSIPFRRRARIDELNVLCGPCVRALYTYDIGISLLDMKARWAPTLAWLRSRRALEPRSGAVAREAVV